MARVRRLLNNERKFVWTPMANVPLVTRVVGEIREDRLQAALERIPERHPLARVRVEYDDTNAAEHGWIDEINAQHRVPIDPLKGPLLRCVLLRDGERTDLILYANHSVCDGTGLVYLTRDLLSLVQNPSTTLKRLSPPAITEVVDADRRRDGFVKRSLKKIVFAKINRMWERRPFRHEYEDYLAVHEAYTSRFMCRSISLELSVDETSALAEMCRSEGVTVNTALTAAFHRALQDETGPLSGAQRKIVIPFDLRKRVDEPVGDVLSLFVGSVEIPRGVRSDMRFSDAVRHLHAEIRSRIESRDLFGGVLDIESLNPGILDGLLSTALMAKYVPEESPRYERLRRVSEDRKNAMVWMASRFVRELPGMVNTNLGRVDIPVDYGDFRIDRMIFPPSASSHVPLQIAAVGIAGTTTVAVSFLEDAERPDASKERTLQAVSRRALRYLNLPHAG